MSKQTSIKSAKLTDLTPDDKNFNKGNEFGEGLIEKSFEKFGAGRSILLDKNNRIIAGNKSTEKFAAAGGENVIIVESDGTQLVAVKRTDIDLKTKRGRELALADNATAKASITWDRDAIASWGGPAQEWGIEFDFDALDLEHERDEAPEDDSEWVQFQVPVTVGQELIIRNGIRDMKAAHNLTHSGVALSAIVEDWVRMRNEQNSQKT